MGVIIAAFYAQRIASYAVLCLVVFVVAAGVIFSGFQLWKSMATGVQMSSEVEISASRVRITSSVVGIVTLTISLVFLYIYSEQIYHIKPVSMTYNEAAPKYPK
jgi:hypothetical protein